MLMAFRGEAKWKKTQLHLKTEETSNIISEGGFTLHKWHSNVERLNSVEKVMEGEEMHAKSLVGNRGNRET